jgi:hypothetical protein
VDALRLLALEENIHCVRFHTQITRFESATIVTGNGPDDSRNRFAHTFDENRPVVDRAVDHVVRDG